MAGGPRSGSVARRLRRAANVREDEVGRIRLIALAFAALEAGRGLGEVGVNTLVLSRLPADALPWLYIPLGILSLIIALAYGAALGRVAKARLFGVTLVTVGVLLVAEFLLLAAVPDVVPIAWLTVMAAGAIAATISWTVATSSLDVRQARRLFPVCTAAAIAGYLAGSLLAGPIAGAVGAPALIGLEGLLFAAAAAVIAVLAQRHVGARWIPQRTARRSIAADVRVGFDEVRRSPLLRLVAAAYILLAILMFSVSFPYLRAARAAYPDEAELARILGIIAATITGISFVVSLALADRFYRRFGIAAAALLLPLVYLGGFGLWVVSFSFATAAAFTIVQQVTQRGISNAAWSAFYNVLPSTHRAQAIAFMDGVPGQIGTVLVGVLLLLSTSLLAPEQIFWLGLVAAAACVAIVVAIRRRYADALLRTLRSGLGEQILEGGPGLGDLLAAPDVRAALIAALHAPDAGTREMAAVLLARSPEVDARQALAAALDDDAPAVRAAAAVAILGDTGGGWRGPRARTRGVVPRVARDRRCGGAGSQPRRPAAASSAARRRAPCVMRRRPVARGPGCRDVRAREHGDTERSRRPRGRAQRPVGEGQGGRRHDARGPSRCRPAGGRPPRHDRRRHRGGGHRRACRPRRAGSRPDPGLGRRRGHPRAGAERGPPGPSCRWAAGHAGLRVPVLRPRSPGPPRRNRWRSGR